MLVLARKVGQSLYIDDDIVITVLKVTNSGEVKLGIQAPDDVVILREELKE